MSGYQGSLSDRQQAALDQFRNAVEDVRRATDTDAFLLRWLRARDFDVTKAEKMYRHHLEWRKENGLDDILHSYEMPETGKEIHSHYFVADMDKLRLRQVYSWQVLKAVGYTLHLMEDLYPECVEKFIIINAPSFFPILWKFLRTLMTQRTADKFEVYGKEDDWKERLLDIVGAEILPAHWGGNMVGPDGDPMCRHKVNYGGRFEVGATTASYDSVFDKKDAQQQTIGRRDRWELPVDVAEAGARLSWRFQTAAGDLAFGLRNHCGQSLIPLQRLGACSLVPQEGTWHCDAPGTYVLEFDNTYSWLNDKTLAYTVNVDCPEKFP
ncbi:SEC14-like protein 2 isoform X2 [Dermacentor variabilis]|uniref:SEC14-like protein 2 isoform X2 n=1 Tax=Dermacentor variabilis TaxID=34621 RepID=UPI003F5B3433